MNSNLKILVTVPNSFIQVACINGHQYIYGFSLQSYKALSTHSTDIMCNGVDNALSYLVMPDSADKEELVATLCDISTAIEKGLAKDSEFGKAVSVFWLLFCYNIFKFF